MNKSHAAGRVLELPTPAQHKELWAQIGKGMVSKERFQGFLRREIQSNPGYQVIYAIRLLGRAKVLTIQDVATEWVEENPKMPFDGKIIEQCAEENKSGKTDWRLVYVYGLSFLELYRTYNSYTDNHESIYSFVNFFHNNLWWTKKEEEMSDWERQNGWTTKGVVDGYRLLDFKPRFQNMTWEEQEAAIAKLGKQYERAEEQAVAEAILAFFRLRGEILLENTFHHVGRNLSHQGAHSITGFSKCNAPSKIYKDGLSISDWPFKEIPYGVVISRKP